MLDIRLIELFKIKRLEKGWGLKELEREMGINKKLFQT